MKHLTLLVISFLFVHLAFGQTVVKAEDLKKYEAKTVKVCSKVAEVVFTPSKTTILYFDKPAPNHTFEIHIFGKDLANFSYVPSEFLKGKTVCVTGEVRMFKGKPDFIVDSEEEMKVQ